jgi:hypothetical protein
VTSVINAILSDPIAERRRIAVARSAPAGTASATVASSGRTRPVHTNPHPTPATQGTSPEMSLPSLFDRRSARLAIVFALVALAIIASVAVAYASSPKVLPVEPDGGIGGEVVLPVEPDGGIGGEVVLPVEPDGGIGN